MIINLTKHNLINNLNIIIKKTKKNIVIFLKITLDSFLIYKSLIKLFNHVFLSCELCIITHLCEINEFCKKIEIYNGYFVFFFLNFGGNIHLKKFCRLNYRVFKKIFIIDFHEWFYIDNLASSKIFFCIDNASINSKYFQFLNYINLKKKKIYLKTISIFYSNYLCNVNQESDHNFYNNIWLEVVYISNMYFLGKIDEEKYKSFIYNVGKKFDFYKNQNNKSLKKKVNQHFLTKTKDLSIFLLRHSSLLHAIINTPSFSLKFRLWKHTGILKLSQLFNRIGLPFNEIKKSWVELKKKIKNKLRKNIVNQAKYLGVNLTKTYSFVKLFYYFKIHRSVEFNKISNIDFVYAFRSIFNVLFINKINFVKKKNYLKINDFFFNNKMIKDGLKWAKRSQDFIIKISRIIISKKTYINEFFLRYSFLQNCANNIINYDTLKNLSFYLMLAFYQKYKKKKAFFIILQNKNYSIVTGSFFKNRDCKKLKEKLKIKSNLFVKIIETDSTKTLTLILETNKEKNFFKNIINFLKI